MPETLPIARPTRGPWWQRHAGLLTVTAGLVLMALRLSPFPIVRGRDLFAHPYRAFWDETFQAVVAERHDDPDFLPHDVMVDAIEGFWPDSYFEALVAVKHLLGGLEPAILVLSFVVAAFFLAGCWHFTRVATGSRLAALLVTLVSATFPRDALVAEWGIDILVPRMITMASAPWIFACFLRAGVRWRASLLFGVLGLLANIHSVSALHLVGILSLAMLLADPRRAVRVIALGAVLCVAGALPVLIHFGGVPTNRPPDQQMVLESSFAYIVSPFFYKATMLAAGFALIAVPALVGFGLARRGLAPPAERRLCLLVAATVGVSLLQILTWLEPALLQYSPLRVTKYFYLFAYTYAAHAVAQTLSRRTWLRTTGAAILAALLVIPAGPFLWARLRRAWPAFDARCIASARQLPRCFKTDLMIGSNLDRGDDAPPGLDWSRLHRMARAVRRLTPPDALFLLPPRGFSPFRLYARRSVVVLGEDSVVGLYDAEAMREWHDRMEVAVTAFESGQPAELVAAARRYGADHLVLRPGDPEIPDATVLWSAEGWRVVRLAGTAPGG